jgi:phospholipase/carboxylesterase
MGGALAMHTAYHLNTNLAGVFCASSFLNEGSIVYKSLDHQKLNYLPLLKMYHSEK